MKIVNIIGGPETMTFSGHVEGYADEAGMIWLKGNTYAGDEAAIARFQEILAQYQATAEVVAPLQNAGKSLAIAFFEPEVENWSDFLQAPNPAIADLFDVFAKEAGWMVGVPEALLDLARRIREVDPVGEIDFLVGESLDEWDSWARGFATKALALEWRVQDGSVLGCRSGEVDYVVNDAALLVERSDVEENNAA